VVDDVQALRHVLAVVHPGDRGAQLEAQVLLVAQRATEVDDVLAADVERDLAAVDRDLLHRGARDAAIRERVGEVVREVVEPAAEGPLGRGRDVPGQP
jgi:hypothetical protein